MKYYDKIIVVSKSDTAIGPMAEAILQQQTALEDILVESAGMVVLFPEPVNAKTEAILVSHGLSRKDHRSRPLTKADLDPRTLLLAVNEEVLGSMDELLQSQPGCPAYTMQDYAGYQKEITSPYGGNLAEYGQCFQELEEMITELVKQLKKEDI